jgi:pyridoxal phosphate enzyme (YggS family)
VTGRAEVLGRNLAVVQARIDRACAAAGRPRSDVLLIAVSKSWPAADVRVLAGAGVRDFGENRLPELQAKAADLADLGLRWHFIGQIQSKKATGVGRVAQVVQSVDRAKVLPGLAAGAGAAGRTLEVLVQVSLDGRQGRGGVAPAELAALADAVAATPGLRLGGIMCLPPPAVEPAAAFAEIAEIAARLRRAHPGATAISAGMSGDLEAAITAGATHVRIGTAVFGEREPVR